MCFKVAFISTYYNSQCSHETKSSQVSTLTVKNTIHQKNKCVKAVKYYEKLEKPTHEIHCLNTEYQRLCATLPHVKPIT